MRILQIKKLIKIWSKRNLTVIGKITVVKTLILPVLNHLIITLPNPTQDILKKVNELIFTFIWSSPVHRVKKELLQSINHLYSHKPYTTVQRRHKYTYNKYRIDINIYTVYTTKTWV